MRTRHLTLLCGATALSALAIMPQAATAQTQPTDAGTPATSAVGSASASSGPQDIVVTARRRNESIVDVPLAITVVTAEKLQKLNLTSTKDIANFVPGLEFSDFTQGNSRNDRGGNRSIIFRGLYLSNNGGGVQQAASMFLDGAAVLGNEIPGGLDIGAVEVLRGPQNVYFGRSTMTGAIAYRTKAIPDHWTLAFNLTAAERKTYRAEASIAGPILPDLLKLRVTALSEGRDGYVRNAYDPSDPLGSQSRKSISTTIDFTPAPSLEIKAYANYFADEDGPSATVNIFPDARPAVVNPVTGAITPPVVGAVTNCVVGQNAFFNGATTPARATICGQVPDVSRAIAYSRTDIPQDYAKYLFNYTPYVAAENFKNMAGLQRHEFSTHAVINFQISDYLKAQSITGYHVQTVIQAIDGAAQAPNAASQYAILFFGLANKYKDFSQELRLGSDPNRAFSWTVGANYVYAQSISQAWNLATTQAGVFNGAGGVFSPSDNRGTTYGLFAGGYLKLADDRLTFSGEARYQIDDRFAQTLNAVTMVPIASSGIFDKKYKAFYPRASVDYDVGAGRKVYASFAMGGRPGGFNSALLSFLDPNNGRYQATPATATSPAIPACGCYAATVAKINSLFGVTNPDYKQEKLSIGEVGFKGYLAGRKGYFDINAYYGILSDQQVTQAQIIDTLSPATTLSIVTNTGKTEIYGVEFTGNYNFTSAISLDTTFAYNHTRRVTYFDNAPGNVAIYGRTDYSGLKLQFAPWITGSAVLSYEKADSPQWSPFGNVALVYRGKQYADIGNLSYIPGRATADLRIGVKRDKLRVEAFVTNLFENLTYPSGNVAADFGINTVNGVRSQYSGFFGAYAEPRTFGARLSATF